ncbi:MAG: OadG family protein [Clostridia bacterium]|nr:OadG family protein [Clostridia bacterium]
MDYTNPDIGQTLMISLVGFCVVFAVLIVLMVLINVMSKIIGGITKKPEVPVAVAPAVTPAAPVGLVLENVSEKEAAMVMAIVADELKKDPAELQFISIKEVK